MDDSEFQATMNKIGSLPFECGGRRWLIEHLTESERVEAEILVRGGCTRSDFEAAIDAWWRSASYGTVWGYLRAVILNRRATIVMESMVPRG